MFLGAGTMAPLIRTLVPEAEIVTRERLSTLSYAGSKKLTRLPRRSAIVAFSTDRVYAIAELIRRYSQWIGRDTGMSDTTDHEAWLNAARKKDWRYWPRYRDMLERKMSVTAVDVMVAPESASTWVMSALTVSAALPWVVRSAACSLYSACFSADQSA